MQTWKGKPPTECDICHRTLMRTFVDGKTTMGPWAIMCPTCRLACGPGRLGVGRGQKYEARGVYPNLEWIKTEG